MAEGSTVAQAPSRKIGVTEQTFYRWRAEYGGLLDQRSSSRRTAVCGER